MPIKRIGQDFIVNTTATNNQLNPEVTALADGRFVVTWRSSDPGDGSGTCIRGRLYNADGTPDPTANAGNDFIVNTTATNSQFAPSVAALADGRFVVTWESGDPGDGNGFCIRGRLYNAGGASAGNDFIVNTTATNDQFAPSVTALADGRFVVTWHSGDPGDSDGTCIRGRLYNADGSAAGNDFIVNTTATDNQLYSAVTALADGRFVVTWLSSDTGDGDGFCIRGRLHNADGAAAGNDFIVNTIATDGQYDPAVTALADGRFVVTWYSEDPGDGSAYCVRGRLYNADGAAAGNDFIVDTTTMNNQALPSVTGLADGRFVVTWHSGDPGDGSGSCIRARLYNIDGSAAGNDFIVNTTATNSQFDPAVTALADGRFVVTWQSEDPGDGSAACIRAQMFNPTEFIGTAGADIWQGGNFRDVINGGDGDDTLSGLGGDDLLSGNAGNDTLSGGEGGDGLSGGDGDDTLSGGEGADGLSGGAGNDTLSGGEGGDGLGGGAGNDTLSGGEGGDELGGGAGIDTASYASSRAGVTVRLATGTGAGGDAEGDNLTEIENLIGSAFADTLIGDAGNNVLDGGAGDDTAVFSRGFDQYLLHELGNKIVVSGPDGSDTLTGIEHLQFSDGTLNPNDGSALFDTVYYMSHSLDVFHAGVNALDHFNAFGWREGRDPNALFDTSSYLAVNKDVAPAGVSPLDHYHQFGWREGRDPSAWFDTTLYLINNSDVAAAGIDPLAHYLAAGMAEGRTAYAAVGSNIAGGFDAQYYLFHNPDVAAAGVDPLFHFNVLGWREGRDPNAWFDTDGYLSHYTDVAAAGVDPLYHYEQHGWREGRDPSAHFDTLDYLVQNPDVAAAHVNPLDHYMQFGIYEGRHAVNDGVWG
jgi:Ca2+-binding RTX toxin-like protein